MNNPFVVDGSSGTSHNSFFFPLDAIRWTRQPEKPTILVEGVNNTGVALVWDFEVERSETVLVVQFRRQRDVVDISPVVIASRTASLAFTVSSQFRSNYSARFPATLILRNAVTSNQEFIYSIEVFLLRNNIHVPGFKDKVQVIVKGKHQKAPFLRSPPVFQLFPENPCSFTWHSGTSI